MVLLSYEGYELRTVETAGGYDYTLLTGICIWHNDLCIGIVEPANDTIAKFVMYPDISLNDADENWVVISKLIRVATDIVQSVLSLI